MGRAGAAPPTSKLGKFLSWPLALSKPIYSNFQINGASGDPYFASKIGGLEVSEFILKLHLFGNCYKLAYLEPRAIKNVSNLEVGGPAPACPTPPVFRLVL